MKAVNIRVNIPCNIRVNIFGMLTSAVNIPNFPKENVDTNVDAKRIANTMFYTIVNIVTFFSNRVERNRGIRGNQGIRLYSLIRLIRASLAREARARNVDPRRRDL
jgi:hypothetical protein